VEAFLHLRQLRFVSSPPGKGCWKCHNSTLTSQKQYLKFTWIRLSESRVKVFVYDHLQDVLISCLTSIFFFKYVLLEKPCFERKKVSGNSYSSGLWDQGGLAVSHIWQMLHKGKQIWTNASHCPSIPDSFIVNIWRLKINCSPVFLPPHLSRPTGTLLTPRDFILIYFIFTVDLKSCKSFIFTLHNFNMQAFSSIR